MAPELRLLAALCCLLPLCPAEVTDSLPKRLMSTAFFPLRHPEIGRGDWLAARDFTERYLRALGLNVTRQKFTTFIFTQDDDERREEGVNLITVLPGANWDSEAEDEILLIGAHYDTDAATTMGIRAGSGMVALLEVGRHIQERRQDDGLRLSHTVILAAFDLMTSEYSEGKAGDSGVEVFIKDFLNPMLQMRPNRRFRGAIMLDSVFNFNSSAGTQEYPQGFAETFPSAGEDLRGNFLAVVNRPDSDGALLESLKATWPSGVGRLQPLSMPQQTMETEAMFEYLMQGHSAFWNRVTGSGLDQAVSPLPAILLTDTGRYRQMPRKCLSGNNMCTARDVLTEGRMRFFNQTVKAVTDSVIAMQAPGGTPPMTISWALLVVALVTLRASH